MRSAPERSAGFSSSRSAGTFVRGIRCARCCAKRRTRPHAVACLLCRSPSIKRADRSYAWGTARSFRARWRSARPAIRATPTMSAHIRYTALDPDAPATTSRPILTDLLRNELRFDGLSMTDSLDMSGIADISIEDVGVTGLEAGGDAMMVTSGIV